MLVGVFQNIQICLNPCSQRIGLGPFPPEFRAKSFLNGQVYMREHQYIKLFVYFHTSPRHPSSPHESWNVLKIVLSMFNVLAQQCAVTYRIKLCMTGRTLTPPCTQTLALCLCLWQSGWLSTIFRRDWRHESEWADQAGSLQLSQEVLGICVWRWWVQNDWFPGKHRN